MALAPQFSLLELRNQAKSTLWGVWGTKKREFWYILSKIY